MQERIIAFLSELSLLKCIMHDIIDLVNPLMKYDGYLNADDYVRISVSYQRLVKRMSWSINLNVGNCSVRRNKVFVRIFVDAMDKDEALKHSKKFEKIISNAVVDIEITNIEQYWKIPEQYCVEFEFSDIIPEKMIGVIQELGNNPNIITNGEEIEEYIFARTTGEINLEKIQWILINVALC